MLKNVLENSTENIFKINRFLNYHSLYLVCTSINVIKKKILRRLLLGWQQSRPPNLPCSPELDVASPTNVTVRIRENVSHIQQNQPIITKYRGMLYISNNLYYILKL